MTQISSLDLSENQISDFSPIQHLTQIKSLILFANQINSLSLRFLNKFKLETLYVSYNPIQNIPKEIFDTLTENVLEPIHNYLEDIEKGKSKNKVLKLIFIGNGSVGKTQIAKRLAEQEDFLFNSQHDSTHAIVPLKRALGGVELQLWDFAGQDVYHATHRLFMQTRALFVLVWDFENEQKLQKRKTALLVGIHPMFWAEQSDFGATKQGRQSRRCPQIPVARSTKQILRGLSHFGLFAVECQNGEWI